MTAAATSRRPMLTVAAMSLASVMLSLDFFGVNVALPAINRELGGTPATQQWIVNAYLLMLAAPLLAAGRLGDLFGRRRVMLCGIILFGTGALISALAGSEVVIIAGRALSGLGAAAVTATSLALVNTAYPPDPDGRRRARAIGIWTALGGIGAAIGPLVAGLLTQHLSWRWVFGFNVPVAIVTAALVLMVVRADPGDRTRNLDLGGTVGVTVGLAFVVAALIEGPVRGWTAPAVIGCAIVGVVVLAVTAMYERRLGPRGLIPPVLARSVRFRRTSIVAAVANAAFSVTMFYLALYLQDVDHWSPSATGAAFLAFTIPLMFTSPFIGRVIALVGGARALRIGLIVLAASFACFALLGDPSRANALVWVYAGLILGGLGQGLAFNGTNVLAMRVGGDDDSGSASGLVSSVRQLGSLLGLAGAGVVFGAARGNGPFIDGMTATMLAVVLLCVLALPLTANPRTVRDAPGATS